ncbi:MAG: fimbria/pilus outer membrane usher protein, partial [Hyphomicrobium sp.]
ANLVLPETVSGYLNVIAGVDQFWGTDAATVSQNGDTFGGRLELDSALRIGGVVVENRGVYDGPVDANICPVEATCVYGHMAGLKRQSSRVIYDMPAAELRLQAGDTDAVAVPLQRSTEVLGIALEKSARKLNPAEDISSAGSGSFRLDSNASVDVMVNGAVVQRLQLRPGNYNLRDLPLTTGANVIELTITTEGGDRQHLKFTSYSDQKLLAPGRSEWAFAAGVPSYLFDNQRTYGEELLATGYGRYGLSDGITANADLQGDADVIMGGAGVDFETPFGIFGLHGAVSASAAGTDGAVNFEWSLANFSGLTSDLKESLHFDAEYRGTNFHTPGEFLNGADGILFAEYNYWLRLNASYTVPVTPDITATLSARYQFGDSDRTNYSPFTLTGDRYGADLTLSAAVGESANASLLVGYSNELYERNLAESIEKDPEFRMALRFNVRPDDATSISSGYDTLGQQAHISAYRGGSSGIDHWDTSVDVQNRTFEKTASVNAAAGYRGNRIDLRLSHYADADGVSFGGFDGTTTRQRTSLRAGTAIAFAGGKFAIGAPVRGGAFAIVAPHESIANKDIMVGAPGNERAAANAWGNALVTDIPAYMPG